MTFTSPEIIGVMLRNNGNYPGDPQMARIYSYVSRYNNRLHWAVFANESHDDIWQYQLLGDGEYVRDVHLLWSRTSGLTAHGKEMLERGEL